MSRFLPFNALQGNSMSHRGHRGWGRFPTYKMTTVSRTCRCRKWTSIAVLVAACPGHPSNGQIRGPLLDGKVMWYVRIYSPLAKFVQLHLSSAARSCCVFMCPSIDPAAIHSPHSLHCTRPFCCSQQECPSPVIRTLNPNGSPPPVMGGRPCQLSSRH